jgi:hypothetical protein
VQKIQRPVQPCDIAIQARFWVPHPCALDFCKGGSFRVQAVLVARLKRHSPRSHAIFLHSMLNPSIISTAMLPLRMSSPCAERSQSIYPKARSEGHPPESLCSLSLRTLRTLRYNKSFPIRASSTFFAFFEKQRTKVDPLTPSFSIAARTAVGVVSYDLEVG